MRYDMTQQSTPLSNEAPQLNPKLDRATLAREFSARGRINIQDVLTQSSAERIYHCLREETPYGLSLNTDGNARGLRNLTPEQQQEHRNRAWGQVGLDGFQFLFDQHQMSLNGEPYADQTHYLAKVMSFLNSSAFLEFARQVTGLAKIEFADAQATLYRSGHFLTAHDDDTPGDNRLAAYVLSLTAAWRPEWGGILEFIDERSQISEGYVPGFNSLRLFQVPMTHHVSIVAPFALVGRYAITGWLRGR